MESRSGQFRSIACLTTLVVAFGCAERTRAGTTGAAGASARPPPQTVISVFDAATSSAKDTQRGSRDGSEPTVSYAVDRIGIVIRGQRLLASAGEVERAIREMLAGLSADNVPALIRAERGAKLAHVSALARAIGQFGVREIDILTPPSGGDEGKRPVLKLSPLGLVPMHRDQCGVLITIKRNDTAELKYLQKGRPVRLPQLSNGPDLSAALREMGEPMKDCPSVVWMLAGEGDATWGPAFHAGITLTLAPNVPERVRYTMLL